MVSSINLHDLKITSIGSSRVSNVLSVRLSDFNEEDAYEIKYEDIFEFRVEDFLSQNIVNQYFSVDFDQNEGSDYEYWIRWTLTLSDGSCFFDRSELIKSGRVLSDSNYKAFVYEPSFGARICVICKSESIYACGG